MHAKVSGAFLLAMLFIGPAAARQQAATQAPEAEQALDKVLQLAKIKVFLRPNRTTPHHIHREHVARSALAFDKTLDEIAERLAGADLGALREREGAGMRAKLALIALDRKKRPELYDEIFERYVKFRVTQRRANHSPSLLGKYKSEEYRLAWEYLLLTPGPANRLSLYEQRALKALRWIGNEASMITVLHFFENTCQGDIRSSPLRTFQAAALSMLGQFQNERALRAILKCSHLAMEQQRRTGLQVSRVPDKVRQVLRNDKWRPIIAAFPRDRLTPEQKTLLDEITDGP